MKKSKKFHSEDQINICRLAQVVSITAGLATLVVTPWFSYDPVNLGKMTILVCGVFIGIPQAMRIIKDTPNEQFRLFNYLFLLLGASLFIPLFLSGAPIDQQFWGTFGRNNGFLTTLALFLIFLFSSLLVGTTGFYDYILRSFKLTGLILLIYGLAQFFNMDPFPWSNSEIFGTLGNVNFFSAFIGMSCIFYIYAFFTEKKKIARLKSIILFSVALFLIIKTNSTQGLFILIVSGSLLLIMLGANLNRRIRYLMILLWLIGVIVGIIGVFNKGPASQFIYQQSTSYRYDYWLAGLRMFFDNFLTGVGLDSYGDFYRMYRDQIAIDKTGPSRMANSAHNGLIDLAATSGFFGLVLTLSVYGFIIYRFIAAVRINKFTELDCLFFCLWFAYLMQSMVSVAQIGVSVWGWIFTGMLFGRTLFNKPIVEIQRQKIKGNLSASQFLFGVVTGSLGFALSFSPLYSDYQFRKAVESRNFDQIRKSILSIGSSDWSRDLAIQFAVESNNEELAREFIDYALKRDSNDYYALRNLAVLKSASVWERKQAVKALLVLDPMNPEIQELDFDP